MGLLRTTESLRAALSGVGQSSTPQPAGVTSAFQFITSGEDNLRVRSWCSVAGVTVGTQGRYVNQGGEIIPFGFTHVPNSDRTLHETLESLAPGALLNVGVFMSGGAAQRGECFVELALVRGLSGATYFLGPLIRGYISTTGSLGWPGSILEHPTDGRGVIKNSGIQDPASGEITGTVPTNALWRVLMIGAIYTSNAFAGVRQPILVFDDGATIYMRSPQIQTQN